MDIVWRGILIGIGATIVMDLWALLLAAMPGQARPNWGLVGRWFWHLRYGRIFHDDISSSAPYKHEVALGWIGHYAVGILYGVIFAIYGGAEWFSDPVFFPVWIFGILTVSAGWVLLQPGPGIGWAASTLPHARQVRPRHPMAPTLSALSLNGRALRPQRACRT